MRLASLATRTAINAVASIWVRPTQMQVLVSSSLYNKIHGPVRRRVLLDATSLLPGNTAGLMIKDPSGTWRNCTRPSQSFIGHSGYSGVLCPDDWTVLCWPRRAINHML